MRGPKLELSQDHSRLYLSALDQKLAEINRIGATDADLAFERHTGELLLERCRAV